MNVYSLNSPLLTTESVRACIEKAVTQAINNMSANSLLQLIQTPLQDFQQVDQRLAA